MAALKVLVIEDMTEYAALTLETLKQIKIEGDWVQTGKEALTYLEKQIPDAILLDLGLPDMTGWDVLTTINEKYAEQHIPIVVLTAHGDNPNRLIGKLQYVSGYIVKPYKPKHLIESLTDILELYKIIV